MPTTVDNARAKAKEVAYVWLPTMEDDGADKQQRRGFRQGKADGEFSCEVWGILVSSQGIAANPIMTKPGLTSPGNLLLHQPQIAVEASPLEARPDSDTIDRCDCVHVRLHLSATGCGPRNCQWSPSRRNDDIIDPLRKLHDHQSDLADVPSTRCLGGYIRWGFSR